MEAIEFPFPDDADTWHECKFFSHVDYHNEADMYDWAELNIKGRWTYWPHTLPEMFGHTFIFEDLIDIMHFKMVWK